MQNVLPSDHLREWLRSIGHLVSFWRQDGGVLPSRLYKRDNRRPERGWDKRALSRSLLYAFFFSDNIKFCFRDGNLFVIKSTHYFRLVKKNDASVLSCCSLFKCHTPPSISCFDFWFYWFQTSQLSTSVYVMAICWECALSTTYVFLTSFHYNDYKPEDQLRMVCGAPHKTCFSLYFFRF